jgi:hypothetical protein
VSIFVQVCRFSYTGYRSLKYTYKPSSKFLYFYTLTVQITLVEKIHSRILVDKAIFSIMFIGLRILNKERVEVFTVSVHIKHLEHDSRPESYKYYSEQILCHSRETSCLSEQTCNQFRHLHVVSLNRCDRSLNGHDMSLNRQERILNRGVADLKIHNTGLDRALPV